MRFCKLLFALVILLVTAAPVLADHIPAEGIVYLSFDPNTRVRSIKVEPGQTFQFYILVDIPSNLGIAGIEGSVSFGPNVVVHDIQWPPRGIDLGPNYPLPDGRNFIVGLGECFATGVGPFALATCTATLLNPVADLEITIGAPPVGPSVPSSFDGEGPGWVHCGFELRLFDGDPTGPGLVLNPTVGTEKTTWGAIKASF